MDDENEEMTTRSSRKKTKTAAAAAAAATTPQRASSKPSSMSTRSGGKKRRRTKETSPPAEEEKQSAKSKRKRARLKSDKEEEDEEMKDSGEEDEEMEEAEADKEEEEQPSKKKKAVAAAKPKAASKPKAVKPKAVKPKAAKPKAASKPKTVEPIAKLRMPSQHTPGKKPPPAAAAATTGAAVAAAYRGSQKLVFDTPPVDDPGTKPAATPASVELQSILLAPQPPAAAAATPTGRHDGLPRRLLRQSSDVLVSFTNTIQEVSTSLLVPHAERMHVEEEEEQEGDATTASALLARTPVWFVLLLVGQLLLSLILPIGPFWTLVTKSSQPVLGLYQGVLGVKEPTAAIIVESEKDEAKIPIDGDVEEDVIDEDEEEDQLSGMLESMNLLDKSTQGNATQFREELNVARTSLENHKKTLSDWRKSLMNAETLLKNVLSAASATPIQEKVLSQDIKKAMDPLAELEKTSPVPVSKLIDVSSIPLWETPPLAKCPATTPESKEALPPTDDDAILTPVVLKRNEQELLDMALGTAKSVRSDPELSEPIRQWVREHVQEVIAKNTTTIARTSPAIIKGGGAELAVGLTSEQVQDVIDKRLEIATADQTGRIDYASLLAGASVIRSGTTRATSPSLVDNLPMLNRLMASWRLRFYGYGPEVALTPTFPTDALGQCWSFENSNGSDKDPLNGNFGTLTVRLAKPVHVTSVVVEHAPKELTDQVQSAIRHFRVVGYEDADANGRPWQLGSFEYKIDAPRVLQEFEVATTKDDEPIPQLQSITLAVDTNYGFPYSCLYRFRVHGEP